MWGKGARERHRVLVPGDDNPKPSLGNGISPRMLLAGLSEQCWSTVGFQHFSLARTG